MKKIVIILLLINTYSICMEPSLEFNYSTEPRIGYSSFEQEESEREYDNRWWENLSVRAALKDMTPLGFAYERNLSSFTIKKVLLRTDYDLNQEKAQTLNTLLLTACEESALMSYSQFDALLATKKIDFSTKNAHGKNIVQIVYDEYQDSCQKTREGTIIDICGYPIRKGNAEYKCCTNEWTMHKILRTTTLPLQCSLIMSVLSQEHIRENAGEPLVKDVMSKIVYLIYILQNELIVAKKYSPSDPKDYYYHYKQHDVYYSSCAYRKQIKEDMMKNPTAEDIRLLWEW